MALSKVGSGSSFDNGGVGWANTNLTKDTGSAVGDLAIIVVSWYENSIDTAFTTPSGFTDHGSFVYSGTGTGESRFDVFSRVIDGTEGASFTVARGSDGVFGTAQLLTLRGSSALSIASVTAGTPASGVTSVAAPSVSGTDGQGLVAAYGIGDPAGTYTDPSGMTLGISEGTEATNTARIYYETLSATGSTGTRTLSWTNTRDAIGVSILVDGAAAGGSPATLSAATPSGTLGTSTTATIGATTDQTTGTFYAVVDTAGNISGVTATQVKAGQNNASAAAVASGNAAVSTTSPSVGVTGLTAATAYSYAAVQNNANGDSNVVTGTFTTAAAGGSTPRNLMLLGVG